MMKAFLLKYWNRLHFTEKDADRRLRAQCIEIASHYGKNIPDLLRGSQQVYDWTEGAAAPTEPTL
jgi:hypothetical protein